MAKLFHQSPEAALIEHVVEAIPLGKQAGRLRPQKQPFDTDVALGNVRGHDEKGEAIHASLQSAVGLFARKHDPTIAQVAGPR